MEQNSDHSRKDNMTSEQASLIVEMHAVNTRVIGMQTANKYREYKEMSPAYSEQAFIVCEQELRHISNQIKEE